MLTPSLPPFVFSVRKQALIVWGSELQPGRRQPVPIPGLINGRAAGTPGGFQEGLPAPQGGHSPGRSGGTTTVAPGPWLPLVSLGPLPAPGLSLVPRQVWNNFLLSQGSVAGRLMDSSPALRPACQKCLQCIQGSPRWAAGGTVRGNKRHGAACSGSQQRHRTPGSRAEMIFHLQLLGSLRPRPSSAASHSETSPGWLQK